MLKYCSNYDRMRSSDYLSINMIHRRISLSIIFFMVLGLIGLLWFKFKPIRLTNTDFSQLPGWQQADLQQSFQAFKKSCQTFMKQAPSKKVGSTVIDLTVNDWQAVCMAANKLADQSNSTLHQFFEQWFEVVYFKSGKPVDGLFTGYYLPLLHGSWQPSKKYRYPIYALPDDLIEINLKDFGLDNPSGKKLIGRLQGRQLKPYLTRKQINQGLLTKAKPILWVDDKIDRFFLEIQGSGYVDMTDGQRLMLGYAGQNGHPYTAIGKVMVDSGYLSKLNLSMQSIRAYLNKHPEKIEQILNQNDSYIFFQQLKHGEALGAQGVGLTQGYSLAVDMRYVPLGMPVWLTTSYPESENSQEKSLQRLMIAQDTGGAIKGKVRGDVFWGGGSQAVYTAGKMKSRGQYWLLKPKRSTS